MSDTSDLLSSLRDIHEPMPPESFSTSWIVLSLLFCSALLVWIFMQRQKKNHRPTSDWHEQLNTALTEKPEQARLRIARLLRQVCMTSPDSDVQHLTGEPWLRYLDSKFSTEYFTYGQGRVFGEDLYRRLDHPIDIERLCADVDSFLKQTHQ